MQINPTNISIKLWPVFAVFFMSLFFLQCKKSDIDAEKQFTVSGIVTDESGSAISGATVQLMGHTSTTGGDGKFSFSGLPDMASYQVEVSATNYFTGHKNVDNIDGSSLTTEIPTRRQYRRQASPMDHCAARRCGTWRRWRLVRS